ncbi:MAG: four helix bundle protein [Kiritimatiellae bacterium]|nr:four helix bundle protein [Kiritimatiellia bacterium]
MAITRFEDIEAWQVGRTLTKRVYECTAVHDFARDYGLKDQIQRAAGSIMHNIAEGFDGGSHPEFARFLTYAVRSATEVQSQLYVALDLRYIDQSKFDELYELAAKAKAKTGAFIKYLRSTK